MWRRAGQLIKRFAGSLSFKLSFCAGLVTFIAVVIFAYHTMSKQEHDLIKERIQAALKDSEVIKAAIWDGMMTKDREVIRQIVQTIGVQENFKEINIYDHKGVLHYSSNSSVLSPAKREQAAIGSPLLTDIENNMAIRHRFADDGNSLEVVNPLRNVESCSSAACHAHPADMNALGALEVKIPLHEMRGKIRENAAHTVIFAFALFLIISTFSGLAIIFGVVPPIRRLQESARKMARGQYIPRAAAQTGSDEISELTRIFNDMSRQINERTRLLEESRGLYKELFEKVPCYLTVINRDFQIVRANTAFKLEFGDLVGKKCYESFKGHESKCAKCPVEKTFADGFPHRSEETWTLDETTNRKAYVIVNTSPIMDENGHVVEVLEMSVDITRAERLQAELQKKEQEFQNLFENVPCYLTVVDPSFRIAFSNRLFSRDFGDCWGKHCYTVYKSRNVKCSNCPVERTFLDGQPHSAEEIWQQTGRDVYVLINTSPVTDENGMIMAVMEMCTNITELKALRSELAVLGETIAGMSHAVKNILAGLEGGVYVVDSGLKSGREDRIRTGWEMVKRNVAKVSDLVRDILTASKERQPEYQECDPAGVLREVFDLYKGRAKAVGVELVPDYPAEMGPARLDPKGIHSAVSNLVSNAIGACASAGGDKKYGVIISGRIVDARLIIDVTDNGVGMSEETKDNLFKKFFSTKGAGGTGLGLVLTRKIVEEHGGRINLESTGGRGTKFTIDIPLTSPEVGRAGSAG